ncbi:MAG: hypothetical protein JXL85_07915 [Bacilli bacterium]|nr:hypothetical protein [Bacilli bacterium]
MRQQIKPFKFYLIIFLFSVALIVAYTLFMILGQGQTVSDVYTLWFMPFIFTGIYYATDWIADRLNKKKKRKDYEGSFLREISKTMQESNEFIIEEFRRLQVNKTFQDDLKKAYYIYSSEEDSTANIDRLEKKYRKGTLENRAIKFVVDYLRENKKTPKTE